MRSGEYFVYLITNKNNTVIYCGMTNNLIERQKQHASKQSIKSFTARYNCYKVVYFERFATPITAIRREKQLKKRSRQYKINLIKSLNSEWRDLLKEANYII